MVHKPLLILLFVSAFSFSQVNDSIALILTQEYQKEQSDSLKIGATLKLSEYQVDKDFSESRRLLDEANLLLNKPANRNLKSEKAMAYSIQGIIFRRTGDYVGSIENYMKSKILYEKLNDSINTSSLLHNIGMVHRYLKEYKKSINYYKESIRLKKRMPNQTYEIACSYNMMGVSFRSLKENDSALWYYSKAKLLFKSINKDIDIHRVNTNIAVLYSNLKEYKKALSIYDQNLVFFKKSGNEISLINTYHLLSTLYKRTKKYDVSMLYADSSLTLAKREGLNDLRSKALLRKSFLYTKVKDYKNAYEFYRRFNRASDSIFNIENVMKIQSLELNYKFEQEKLKDSLQFSQDKREIQLVTDNESSKKKLYFILFLTTLVLSIVIVYLLIRDYKQKKRLLKLENKELLIEKEEITNAFDKLKNSNNAEERIKAKQDILKLKILTEHDWNHFRDRFEILYPNFLPLLKETEFKFTKSEERFLILKKLNIETKEIAEMIGISNDSVLKTQYRIRKKTLIPKGIDMIVFLDKLSDK